MADDNGASALQQFCLLAKSAKGPACASLIGQALEHPSIFVFGELLDTPSVKEARSLSFCLHTHHAPSSPAREAHSDGAR